jgi:hypothetical protein
MRILCSLDNVELDVSEHALLHSHLLADIASQDPEGVVQLPCDSRTWEAWQSRDTAPIHDATMMLAVFEVRCWAVSLTVSRAEFFLSVPKS